ncbi:hypothetical protein PRK78_003638 [Emydomyces testavorans]|uniref:Rhodopsin domain-containing protein n=1 Tax=Emydomyces testavorans TaxID=2070801 RepID=A0AAF0DGK7_9EURO|nr:hypothetical protein PRK78_003638 [Emydomyces testavorans]
MVNIGLPTPDHPNRGWHVWVVGTVMVIVAAIFVAVRLAVRYLKGGIQMDDWTILAALISASMFTTSHNISVGHGYGMHDWDLTKDQKTAALKGIFVSQVLYKIVVTLTKTSILLLYLRVFSVARGFCRCCIAMIIFTVVSCIAYLGPTIWQCQPIHAFWDRSVPHVCISNRIIWLSYALINIVSDFVILFLPMQQVLRLQLKLRDKIALIMIFMLGGFVCITSIIRTTSFPASSQLSDVTWNTILISVWSAIEINTGIICACLPMIRKPLSFLFPNIFSASNRSTSGPYTLSYGATMGRKSRNERSTPAGEPGIPYAEDHVFMASVKPGGRDGHMRRTESEENMISLDHIDHNGTGIVKTMNVSVSESPRAGYESSRSRNEQHKLPV